MARKVYKLKGLQPEKFSVICVASHQNHYRLSWALNKLLNIHFQKSDDLIIKLNKANVQQSFSKYSFVDESGPVAYHLISNKSEQGFLLKELPNIDYLLKIEGEADDKLIKQLITRIKNLEIVITAFELQTISNIQSKKLTF
jgi:hypothetical protein